MKVACISDMHGLLPRIEKGLDALFICGDIVPLHVQRNYTDSVRWLRENFAGWCAGLDIGHIFLIAGNHDFVFEKFMYDNNGKLPPHIYTAGLLGWDPTKVTYLRDSSYEYLGVSIYGTPWCRDLWRWAFYKPSPELSDTFAGIPENIDVLLTHMPGKSVHDIGVSLEYPNRPDFGSPELTEAVTRKKPKYWFCGHVHSGNHSLIEFDGTKAANVSLLDEQYKAAYPPLILDI